MARLNATEIAENAFEAARNYCRLYRHGPSGVAMHPETRHEIMRDQFLSDSCAVTYHTHDMPCLFGIPVIVSTAIPPDSVYMLPESVVRGVQEGFITSLDDLRPLDEFAAHGILTRNEIRNIFGIPPHMADDRYAPCTYDSWMSPNHRMMRLEDNPPYASASVTATIHQKKKEWTPKPGVELGGEPINTDIIDNIDTLLGIDIDDIVDDQLRQESSGWDHNINQERCLYCTEPWHGLAITRDMQRMRRLSPTERDIALAEYRYADDTSDVICPGSPPRLSPNTM